MNCYVILLLRRLSICPAKRPVAETEWQTLNGSLPFTFTAVFRNCVRPMPVP